MDILNSQWLIQMLKKSASTPEARLLSLFEILEDWTEAPGITEQFKSNPTYDNNDTLKNYLSLEAAKAGAALPEMLATQLHMMAMSALQEQIISENKTGLAHAKSAAQALITAQTKKEFHIARSSAYAIAASFIGALMVAGGLFYYTQQPAQHLPHLAQIKPKVAVKTANISMTASPQSTAALMQQIEQMRHGNCRLLEAIQLPDAHKSVYFKNIVLGQITTDREEQALVKELLAKIRCNYSPMLMKKST